jgi:RNA polymerase sigma-32 factor
LPQETFLSGEKGPAKAQANTSSQKLVVSNLKLVAKIALEYYNSYLNILDLIQEGNMGLVHAVKKYNPYKGMRFSTYASFWIRAYI